MKRPITAIAAATSLVLSMMMVATASYAYTPQQEKNIANAKAYVVAFMLGDAEAAAKYMAPNYKSHAPGAKNPNKESTLKAYTAWAPMGKDWKVTKTQAFADGDNVIVRYLCQPIKTGPDAPKDVIGWEVMKFDANNQVAEHWAAEQEVPKEVANPNGAW